MAFQEALVFKFEEVFFNPSPNYSNLYELIKKEEQESRTVPRLLPVGERMLALKKLMKPKAYKQLLSLAEAAAETAETQSLSEAPLLPGVSTALDAAHDAGWFVAVASDLGKVSVSKALGQKSLTDQIDLVAARTRLDESRELSKRLAPVRKKVRTLTRVVYFCNRSQEVKEAKSLGMRCMVLPSKTEPFRTLLWAEPNGIILSLQELPQLLALPSMKLPEREQPVTGAQPAPDAGKPSASPR